jgi:anti-sigma-K factor RskA
MAGRRDSNPRWNGTAQRSKNGVVQVRFEPVEKAEHVKAFAISVEREGGVPKKEGPILLVGSTWDSSFSFLA